MTGSIREQLEQRGASSSEIDAPRRGPGSPLLAVEDLHVEFRTRGGVVNAVNGIRYTVSRADCGTSAQLTVSPKGSFRRTPSW